MAGFKARARALDMLGRQQIAGIPTAISELFKNSYDAYADNVVVDYFRSDGLFILRDDGIGMTKDEFENRWLTVGTESKLGGLFGLADKYIPKNKEPRILMGEKGIGRLAIAMIGSQVLIVTRAIRDEQKHKFVVSFINWKLFECPGLNLEDIYVPIEEFESFPTNEEVNNILQECIFETKKLNNRIEKVFFDSIIDDLNTFKEGNILESEEYIEAPCQLDDCNSGTRFYVYPSNEFIVNELDTKDDEKVSSLKKMLIGFTDTVMPGHKKIPLKTYFRDYKYPEYFEDLFEETNFFTEDEFHKGDHIFKGKFDEHGQFKGSVYIYGKDTAQEYVIPWNNHGKKTTCGAFTFVLMGLQGNASESNLDKNKHIDLYTKLNNFGGIYVYKDGIKVLPYGDNRYDFLDVEKRRTVHAGANYWSYRRMLGAIRLTAKENSNLKEKAGREGYQENAPYHEMRSILISFLKQTAKDFFNDGVYSSDYNTVKEKNIKLNKILEKEKKTKKDKENNFLAKLKHITNSIETNYFENKCKEILSKLDSNLLEVDALKNKEVAALKLLQKEKELLGLYRELKVELVLTKPKGMALKKSAEFSYSRYLEGSQNIRKDILEKTYDEIEERISKKSKDAQLDLDRRYRIEQSLSDISKSAKKMISSSVKDTDTTLIEVQDKVTQSTRDSLKNIEEVIRNINIDVSKTDFKDMEEEEIASWRMKVEDEILSVMETEKDELETIKGLLDTVQWEKDSEGKVSSYIDVMEANDSKINELTEKSDLDSDLAQLGMAIHVINHEFDSSIKVVRENLRRLKGWSDVNTGLTGIYKGIKDSFEHLDSYLTLFTPLNRRLQRKKTDIQGHEIEEFLDKLFLDRFKRHNIELKASKAFRKSSINSFPSTLYPVFVNLIDNATYWVKGQNEKAIISLDADDKGYIISNTGQALLENDKETIFEMGFTRKPAGRGLGLHISRDVLSEQNMDILVIDPLDGYRVSFKIIFSKDEV